MAELADAPDSKSGGKPCGFESHHRYQWCICSNKLDDMKSIRNGWFFSFSKKLIVPIRVYFLAEPRAMIECHMRELFRHYYNFVYENYLIVLILIYNFSIIKIKNGETTKVVCQLKVKTHLNRSKFTDVFFYCLFA